MEVLDGALYYAACGWPVFPVDGKTPFAGTHGSKDATTNEHIIRDWWYRWPKANVVVMAGEASGLTVLDVDMHGHDGKATLAALVAQHGALPPTPVSHTGGGGMHILFAHNAAVKRGPIEGQAGLEIVNWFVAPPSIHPKTHLPYQWNETLGPDVALAPVPGWLAALTKVEHRPTFSGNGHYVLHEGERHYGLLRFAGWLRDRGLCEVAIAEALMALNTYHCDPPMSEREIYEMAHDVEQRYQPSKGLPVHLRRKERDERLAGL